MPEATLPLIFTTAFLIAFSGAMMPGPLLAYTISASAQSGFRVGPLLILGHAILELGLITALVLGLDHFIQSDTFSSIVGLIGGAILTVMGFVMARKGWNKTAFSAELASSSVQSRRMVVSGIVISMSNPYWFIWWATIGLTYLLWSLDIGTIGVVSFFSGHILADLAWYTVVALVVSSGRRVFSNEIYWKLLIFCGIGVIVIGIYFIISGFDFLLH